MPPPPENPEPSSHIVFDGFQCQGSGFLCTTQRYEFTECGEGITYHTCTQVFKDTRDAQLGRWAWDVFLVTEQ